MKGPLSLFSLGLDLINLFFPSWKDVFTDQKVLPTLNFIPLHSIAKQNSKRK